jgi:hypothetical protein
MTLNVNLEDVPWAILEAVKLRIMARRRAMEQSRLEPRPVALRPLSQFAKLGARSDHRRPHEPVAILEMTTPSLIVYFENDPVFLTTVRAPENQFFYKGPQPVGNSSVPTASDLPVIRLLGQDPIDFGNALAVSGFIDGDETYLEWIWGESNKLRLSNKPWTLELFCRLSDDPSNLIDAPRSGFLARAVLDLRIGDFNNNFAVCSLDYLQGEIVIPTKTELTWIAKTGDTVIQSPADGGIIISKEELTSPGHLCIQRLSPSSLAGSSIYAIHYNGVLMVQWEGDSNETYKSIVSISALAREVPNVTIGQARLTPNKSLYGLDNFSPPMAPFKQSPSLDE